MVGSMALTCLGSRCRIWWPRSLQWSNHPNYSLITCDYFYCCCCDDQNQDKYAKGTSGTRTTRRTRMKVLVMVLWWFWHTFPGRTDPSSLQHHPSCRFALCSKGSEQFPPMFLVLFKKPDWISASSDLSFTAISITPLFYRTHSALQAEVHSSMDMSMPESSKGAIQHCRPDKTKVCVYRHVKVKRREPPLILAVFVVKWMWVENNRL